MMCCSVARRLRVHSSVTNALVWQAKGSIRPQADRTRSSLCAQTSGRIDVTLADAEVNLMVCPLQVGNQQMRVVSPFSADEVMDYYIARGQEEKDPYWAIVWASAIAMSELLQQQPDLVRGKRVAEIGCGLGLAGTAAALAGAKEVVLMDREVCALQCALMTATASGVSAQSASSLARNEVERESILAFEAQCREEAPVREGKPSCRVQVAPFDWTLPFEDAPFDVVIACDVLYENFSVEPLASIIPIMLGDRSLAQSLLLTDPPRRAPENRIRFMQLIAERDPEMMVRFNKIASPVHEGKNTDVQLIVLQRRVGGQTVGMTPLSVK